MTIPFFSLYVIWHPSYSGGRKIADRLRTHLGVDFRDDPGAWRRVSVLERSEPLPDSRTPLPVDWNDAELTASVILADSELVGDSAWINYVRETEREAARKGIHARLFPVTIDQHGLEFGFTNQALRWDLWRVSETDPIQRLKSEITHGLCRMLQHRIDMLQRESEEISDLEGHLNDIPVFISYSKHDDDKRGELMSRSIRNWIGEHSSLGSFLDIYDILPGAPFEEVLLHKVSAGAVVAVHSDTYSSRMWCRREVIEAKRRLVPIVVIDCIRNLDTRSMPYLGNVPIVRAAPDQSERIAVALGCLLDETFRTLLWLCQIGGHLFSAPGVVFSARPPELMTLAALSSENGDTTETVVYPGPLLGSDDERILMQVAPQVRLQTLPEWLEGRS